MSSFSWTTFQERGERKCLPELSLEAENVNMGGGDLAIGPQPHRQGSYSWECTEALLKILKYYTHTMPGLVEASIFLIQHSSTIDWLAPTLTRRTCTD